MASPSLSSPASRGFGRRTWLIFGAVAGTLLLYAALTAKGGVPDPTSGARLSHGAVVVKSGLLVFREGLEAVLVLAAVTASFLGANRAKLRPVGGGAALGLGASVVT